MDLTNKGWLKKYIAYRGENFTGEAIVTSQHPDYSIYRLLQPTGLLYGTPVQPESIDSVEFESLAENGRMKVLLAESLINTYLIYHHQDVVDAKSFRHAVDTSITHVVDFYNNVYPEISVRTKSLLGKEKDVVDLAEQVIEKRVKQDSTDRDSFWQSFFNNTLVFLDIYFFGQWIHTQTEKVVTEFFKLEKEGLRLMVIKVMVAAAHANNIVEIEEKKLFGYLVNSARLSRERSKEAWGYLEKGLTVDELALPENNSWLLKKYLVELAALTVWADRVVDEDEKVFLQHLNKHFGFLDDDLEKSMMAIESFVLAHWGDIGALSSHKGLEELSEEFADKLRRIAQRNESILVQSVMADESLVRLIEIYQAGSMDEADADRLKAMLIEIIQGLTAFSTITLPSDYLTLPVLFKILPEAVYSSSKEE